MSIQCTRCDGTGFLNIEQVPENVGRDVGDIENWMKQAPAGHDVMICDCCGDGMNGWYGEPGFHYGSNDLPGHSGPYAYNGGLCECN